MYIYASCSLQLCTTMLVKNVGLGLSLESGALASLACPPGITYIMIRVKPCPHCRRKRRDNSAYSRTFLRQSLFSPTNCRRNRRPVASVSVKGFNTDAFKNKLIKTFLFQPAFNTDRFCLGFIYFPVLSAPLLHSRAI